MKSCSRAIILIVLIVSGFSASAQTALPTSWDCTSGTMPSGWTTSVSDYYVSTSYIHSPPNALKFDGGGMHTTIHFTDEPDTLEYYIRGAYFSGGTFSVQESINGSSWSDLRVFTDANLPNTSLATALPFRDTLSKNSRYVRFKYTSKVAGNVAVDDIRISRRPPGPEAEIAVKFNGSVIPSGQTAINGNSDSIRFLIINYGTDSVLSLTNYQFIGSDASMFQAVQAPSGIPAGDSAMLILSFLLSGADGTKTATLNITNNDGDENPYIINLWAVKGCCANEPSYPARNLYFTSVKSYEFRVNFSDSTQAPDKYLVLIKKSPITEEPADGVFYPKGAYIGDAQVAFVGQAGYFNPSAIVAGTTYYIKIFPFNGYAGYENYLTSNAEEGNVTTQANMTGTYYAPINLLSSSFRQDLHNLINNHLLYAYDYYGDYVISKIASRDTAVGNLSKKTLSCSYSGENYVYQEPFSFGYFSREHNFCQSWMPTNDDPGFSNLPEYADYHNLLPTNQNAVNTIRNNYPLGEVVNIQSQYYGAKVGFDSLGHKVYEPRDQVKGDAARAMFYMVLCYDMVASNHWYLPAYIQTSIPYGQSETLLKKWHQQDPPDHYEMAKNDYIFSLQQNRNPFIDNPSWADLIDFSIYGAFDEHKTEQPTAVMPNPVTGISYIEINPANGPFEYCISDMAGKNIYVRTSGTDNKISIKRDDFEPGIYLIHISFTQNRESFVTRFTVL